MDDVLFRGAEVDWVDFTGAKLRKGLPSLMNQVVQVCTRFGGRRSFQKTPMKFHAVRTGTVTSRSGGMDWHYRSEEQVRHPGAVCDRIFVVPSV